MSGQLLKTIFSLFLYNTNLLLKFNYAVEIGAYLAYRGHYKRTGDISIRHIAREELKHRYILRRILRDHNAKPFWLFNRIFKTIGSVIEQLCRISPLFLLDYVARSMELFAIVNYKYLLDIYPDYDASFRYIIKSEENHKRFFSRR
jgi:rubrerythrin